MPLLRETATHEWHAVQCAKCTTKMEIRIKAGSLSTSKQFNAAHEFVCKDCRETKPTQHLVHSIFGT